MSLHIGELTDLNPNGNLQNLFISYNQLTNLNSRNIPEISIIYNKITKILVPRDDRNLEISGPRGEKLTKICGPRGDRNSEISGPRGDRNSEICGPRGEKLTKISGPGGSIKSLNILKKKDLPNYEEPPKYENIYKESSAVSTYEDINITPTAPSYEEIFEKS